MTEQAIGATRRRPSLFDRPWNVVLLIAFAIGSGRLALESIIEPRGIGSHASIYTDAARAWLSGGDPWAVGPPAAVYSGPPTMLVPFVPFVPLPVDLTRVVWVVGGAVMVILVLRRVGLPGWWIGFPPIFQAIQLGHPEVLVLWLLVFGGLGGGLAPLIKPYAGLALLAGRRWTAIAIGLAMLAVTTLLLPWARFVDEWPRISANLAAQAHGDTAFGQPVLMVIAVIALASLGPTRALWLATPVLWPSAQPIYKAMTVPALSPILAVFWSIPIPGATLAGLVVEASIRRLAVVRPIPTWLRDGIDVPGTHLLGPREMKTSRRSPTPDPALLR